MLGFELDFWDYATFATAALAGFAGVMIYIWIAGLPGRIALARKHVLQIEGRLRFLLAC